MQFLMNFLNLFSRLYARLHNYPGVPFWVLTPLRKIVRYGANRILPRYLEKAHTHRGTIENGVNGRRFTGPNGGSIFLPAAGCRLDNDFHRIGSGGYYWEVPSYSRSVPGSGCQLPGSSSSRSTWCSGRRTRMSSSHVLASMPAALQEENSE